MPRRQTITARRPSRSGIICLIAPQRVSAGDPAAAPLLSSHSCTTPFCTVFAGPLVTRSRPFAVNATNPEPRIPENVLLPLTRSQTIAVLNSGPIASIRPSGENCMELTLEGVWIAVPFRFWVAISPQFHVFLFGSVLTRQKPTPSHPAKTTACLAESAYRESATDRRFANLQAKSLTGLGPCNDLSIRREDHPVVAENALRIVPKALGVYLAPD